MLQPQLSRALFCHQAGPSGLVAAIKLPSSSDCCHQAPVAAIELDHPVRLLLFAHPCVTHHSAICVFHMLIEPSSLADATQLHPLQVDRHNWFSTGDVACIDPLGYMSITDRSKDVVKSGGEWISSIGESVVHR